MPIVYTGGPIAGLRGTGDFGDNERPENFRETILFLNPNGEAPLTALMSKMGSDKTDDPVFHWFEEKQQHTRVSVNDVAVVDETQTSITLDDASGVVPGDILMVEDATVVQNAEQILVSSISGNVLTVVRQFGGSDGTGGIADNTFLVKVGSAFSEGSGGAQASSRNPNELKNQCQIFKTAVDITETARATHYRTGNAEANEKKRKMFDHSVSMEMASIFGRYSLTTGANGKPMRTMDGLTRFITTNNTAFASGSNILTEDKFIDAVCPVFDWDGQGAGDERIAFCGNKALTALNKLAKSSAQSRVTFDGIVKVYGMKLMQWTLPQGTIYLRTHPLFNIHPVYSSCMLGINPKGIKERALRSTKFKPNIQGNDEDTYKGEWLTETGIEVNHEETMFFLSGVDSANFT
jgi:hypothetical protein